MPFDVLYLAMMNHDGGKDGSRRFTYRTTDAVAAIGAADYFTDGVERGMRPGDIVEIVQVDDLANPTTFAYATGIVSATNAQTGTATVAVPATAAT